jgi:RNA polymerase sigma-70 factor (ECF subfamily)
VALVALQGLDHKQAARVLGTHEGTIAWRIHEARARLRVLVDGMQRPKPQPAASRQSRSAGRPSIALPALSHKPLPS